MKDLSTLHSRMKIKNVKLFNEVSKETHCYQASLYFDDVRAADLTNDGNGGESYLYPLHAPNGAEAYAEMCQEFEKADPTMTVGSWALSHEITNFVDKAIHDIYIVQCQDAEDAALVKEAHALVLKTGHAVFQVRVTQDVYALKVVESRSNEEAVSLANERFGDRSVRCWFPKGTKRVGFQIPKGSK